MSVIKFTYKTNQHTFDNFEQAVESLCPYMSVDAVLERLNNHWTIQQALDLEVYKQVKSFNWVSQSTVVRVNGDIIQFDSYVDLLNEVSPDIAFETFKSRVRTGWPLDESLGLKARVKVKRSRGVKAPKATAVSLNVNGQVQSFQTINQARKALKVRLPRDEIVERLALGWDVESAFGFKSMTMRAA